MLKWVHHIIYNTIKDNGALYCSHACTTFVVLYDAKFTVFFLSTCTCFTSLIATFVPLIDCVVGGICCYTDHWVGYWIRYWNTLQFICHYCQNYPVSISLSLLMVSLLSSFLLCNSYFFTIFHCITLHSLFSFSPYSPSLGEANQWCYPLDPNSSEYDENQFKVRATN